MIIIQKKPQQLSCSHWLNANYMPGTARSTLRHILPLTQQEGVGDDAGHTHKHTPRARCRQGGSSWWLSESHCQTASSQGKNTRAPRFANNCTETNSVKLAQGGRERQNWDLLGGCGDQRAPMGVISQLRFERWEGTSQMKDTAWGRWCVWGTGNYQFDIVKGEGCLGDFRALLWLKHRCKWENGERGGRQAGRGVVHTTAFSAKLGSWFLICRLERAMEWVSGERRHNQTFISKRQL